MPSVLQLGLLTSQRPQLRQRPFASQRRTYLGLLGGIGKRVLALNHDPLSAVLNRAIIR